MQKLTHFGLVAGKIGIPVNDFLSNAIKMKWPSTPQKAPPIKLASSDMYNADAQLHF